MNPEVQCRTTIVDAFARWTALSALRSGSSVKSRTDVYRLLRIADFSPLLMPSAGPVSADAFNAWHRQNVLALAGANRQLGVGWAAKLVNVYLKTVCYVGDLGAPGVRDALHPPVDAGLWQGIEERFKDRLDILSDTHHVTTIRGIQKYEDYERIISGCRRAANVLGCRLIEVEQLWKSGDKSSAWPVRRHF
jgi:hypothetical protein